MNTPLTAKQEAFARAVAAGATLADAYREVYAVKPDKAAKDVANDAHKVANLPHVAERIAHLRAQLTAQLGERITYDYVHAMRELDEFIADATAAGELTPRLGAINAKMKISGLFVAERKNERPPAGALDYDKAAAALEALLAIRKANAKA